MVWCGLVKILKLNSRPLINHKGRYRAARAAKNWVGKSDGWILYVRWVGRSGG